MFFLRTECEEEVLMKVHTFSVCAYGDSPYLADCLASVVSQTATRDSQIIVCTSTPSEYIRNLASSHGCPVFVNDAEPGIAADWNFAIQAASTPYVTITHQDDVYCPEYAARAIRALNTSAHPLLYFSDYGELKDGRLVESNRLLRVKRKLLRPLAKESNRANVRVRRRMLSFGSPICCPAVTFAVDNLPAPLFRSGMRGDLDWDAWERVSRMKGDFIYDKTILMHHRIHEGSETTALIQDNTRTEEDLEMLCRFWPHPIARIINIAYSRGQKSNG